MLLKNSTAKDKFLHNYPTPHPHHSPFLWSLILGNKIWLQKAEVKCKWIKYLWLKIKKMLKYVFLSIHSKQAWPLKAMLRLEFKIPCYDKNKWDPLCKVVTVHAWLPEKRYWAVLSAPRWSTCARNLCFVFYTGNL